jgi:hypothetical protein
MGTMPILFFLIIDQMYYSMATALRLQRLLPRFSFNSGGSVDVTDGLDPLEIPLDGHPPVYPWHGLQGDSLFEV